VVSPTPICASRLGEEILGTVNLHGMKAHLGVDSKTKIIHTAVVTAANVSDVAILPDLLHGEETRVWGDGAYQGQRELIRECAPRARDYTRGVADIRTSPTAIKKAGFPEQ